MLSPWAAMETAAKGEVVFTASKVTLQEDCIPWKGNKPNDHQHGPPRTGLEWFLGERANLEGVQGRTRNRCVVDWQRVPDTDNLTNQCLQNLV